jgi:TonB family protein
MIGDVSAAALLLFAAAAAVQFSPAAPQDQYPAAGAAAPPDNGVRSPVKIVSFVAEYSPQARLAKLQGTVTLGIVIGVDGKAHEIHVLQSLGLGLDENAIAAASKWRFVPGKKDRQPVAVETYALVHFSLPKDPTEWSLARAQFMVPQGAVAPSILQAPYPPPAGHREDAQARVAVDIDPQGIPANIRIEDSSDPKWNNELVAMIGEWRFQPALQDGTAIQSHAILDFMRGLRPDFGPMKWQ